MLSRQSEPNQIQAFLGLEQEDILQQLLADKRSPNTRRAYQKDLQYFFKAILNAEPSPQVLAQFLTLERAMAIAVVLKYKAGLIDQGLKEATVNRRLAAIKALVKHAGKLGKCTWTLSEVASEKVIAYRDTTGVDQVTFRNILETVDKSTLKGIRDFAILHLLWSNALRRNEVVSCDISDFIPEHQTLYIFGKGRGTQREKISLSVATAKAMSIWLEAVGSKHGPIFTALDKNTFGHRLTGQAVYDIVKATSKKAGISKVMSPHRCRHSSITAALKMTGGDVRKVQKLSRHKKIDTLLIYDDNRINAQGEITDTLSNLLD